MINANLIRKIPETLENFNSSEFENILKLIENMIFKYNTDGANAIHINICTKKLDNDQYFLLVESEQHRKSLTRIICTKMLENDFDVLYSEYVFNHINYTKISIKW